MTQPEYHDAELSRLAKQIDDCKKQPMKDKAEAVQSWLDLLRDPATMTERVEWILVGHYGYGAMVAMQRIQSAKGNRAAQAGQLLAALECTCPDGMARKAWLSLSKAEQDRANKAIMKGLKA